MYLLYWYSATLYSSTADCNNIERPNVNSFMLLLQVFRIQL